VSEGGDAPRRVIEIAIQVGLGVLAEELGWVLGTEFATGC